ncbi:MAG: pectate lyase [Phycisphaeraceae bacterium]|nr:pectate lyase [Phycisphaeraceae bacterium]
MAALTGTLCSAACGQPLPAFPTAEGFGAVASGGRGGAVYHVTNLDDGGPGSLRHGIGTAVGPTTIVFEVGGSIELNAPLTINRSDLTIAGQTAPGGIAITGHETRIESASDVIIRYMSMRTGDRNIGPGAGDSLRIVNADRIIVDHVSTAWGLDETLSVTRSNNITVQHSIIAETLNPANHAFGSLVRGNIDAANQGGYTFHHNLWIHNDRRNPALGSYQEEDKDADLEIELVNNVIVNWGTRSIHTVESRDPLRINLINNMFIAGPSTSSGTVNEVLRAEIFQQGVNVYESGNLIDSDQDAAHDPEAVTRSMFRESLFADISFVGEPFTLSDIEDEDTAIAYDRVLQSAGASLHRDAVDERLIQDVVDRTGAIIVSQDEVGGYPVIVGGVAPVDTDRDGMPDGWETSLGLDPDDAADGPGIAFNGYTNLENYLNTLSGDLSIPEPATLALLAWGAIAPLLRRR